MNYETATLLAVQQQIVAPPFLKNFWMRFFTRGVNFDTDKIMFDEIDTIERRMAPFVAPNVQGRIIRSKGFDTKSFKAAYVKPKHVVDPSRALPRVAGENPLGQLSQRERFDLIVVDNMRREKEMVENRWDWLACRAIVDGQVTISGQDYPTVTVDFKRDPSLTGVLVGAAQWSQATATPMADIRQMRTSAFSLSYSPITDLVFGIDAWDAFADPKHDDVQKLLDSLKRGSTSEFNNTGMISGAPFEYQGLISGPGGAGALNLWTYSNQYEVTNQNTGVATYVDYFDRGSIVGYGALAMQGTQAFGAIQDKQAQFVPLSMYPKMWDEVGDPSVTYTMTQSAPLMIPLRPNNTFKLKVV